MPPKHRLLKKRFQILVDVSVSGRLQQDRVSLIDTGLRRSKQVSNTSCVSAACFCYHGEVCSRPVNEHSNTVLGRQGWQLVWLKNRRSSGLAYDGMHIQGQERGGRGGGGGEGGSVAR